MAPARDLVVPDVLYVAVPNGIKSDPPAGMLRVVNIYVDPATGKLVVEYETKE